MEKIGDVEEIVDLGPPNSIGEVIGALLEDLERSHPGVPILNHAMTVRSPIIGQPPASCQEN